MQIRSGSLWQGETGGRLQSSIADGLLLSSSAARGTVNSCPAAPSAGQAAHHAAIFKRQAVGIFEIDRPSPSVVADIGDFDALGAELIALVGQSGRRPCLAGKMIEGGWNSEAVVDACIKCFRHVRNALRFDEGKKPVAPDIEKEVSKTPAFLNPYCVDEHRPEAQNTLVELSCPVEAKRREANVGKSSMANSYRSSCSGSLAQSLKRLLAPKPYDARTTAECPNLRRRLQM
jgi:hypothetical protein